MSTVLTSHSLTVNCVFTSAVDNQETALHMAAAAKDQRAVFRLMKAGANPLAKNIDNRTPLNVAHNDDIRKLMETQH